MHFNHSSVSMNIYKNVYSFQVYKYSKRMTPFFCQEQKSFGAFLMHLNWILSARAEFDVHFHMCGVMIVFYGKLLNMGFKCLAEYIVCD